MTIDSDTEDMLSSLPDLTLVEVGPNKVAKEPTLEELMVIFGSFFNDAGKAAK